MKKFETPEVEVMMLAVEDVLTGSSTETSINPGVGGPNEGDLL